MKEQLDELRWEHYIAIGLLLKNDGNIDEDEARRFDPKVRIALSELSDKGLLYWGEYLCLEENDVIGYNRQGYSLTDDGREYIEKLSKQGVELFPFFVADEWEYPDTYKTSDLEKEVIT